MITWLRKEDSLIDSTHEFVKNLDDHARLHT